MSKHTPGPWIVEDVSEDGLAVFSETGPIVAQCHRPDASDHAANAERIIACVNGCEGLNPEAFGDLLEALKHIVDAASERDYGLSDLASAKMRKLGKAIQGAENAIAKAEGGQG